MKTNEFLSLSQDHPNKHLLFKYSPGKVVAPGYHITEIKNITIDSVDCGAGVDFWKETVIQLWEDPRKNTDLYMSAEKALAILNKIDRLKPMEREVEIKFEYSNPDFQTAQLFVNPFSVDGNELVMKLRIEKTDCKANEACGIATETITALEAICTPGGSRC